MKTTPFLVLCLSLSVLISCQKEISQDTQQEVTTADTLLHSIVVGDTINPGKNMSVWEFIYDDQKRVTEIKSAYLDSVNGALTIHEEYSSFFYYNGEERLPFKTFDYRRNLAIELEMFHFYDNSGRLMRDSIGAPDNSKLLTEYQHLPGKIIMTMSIYDENGIVSDQLFDSFYVAGNNITNGFITFPHTQGDENVFEFTYDNKINPLSKLNISSYMGIDGIAIFNKMYMLSPGYSRNNVIKRHSTSTYMPLTNTLREFEFTYNSNNMPISGNFKLNGDEDEGIRIHYTYTH
jgi:hypothetical protein